VNVKSISVLLGFTGVDRVTLELLAETPFPTMGYPASAVVEAQSGCGLAWAKKHFPGIPIEVIDVKARTRTRFSRVDEDGEVEHLAEVLAHEMGQSISRKKREKAQERFSRPVSQLPEPEEDNHTCSSCGEVMNRSDMSRHDCVPTYLKPDPQPRGNDCYPIQDNGPEVPDYGRGGDGPPAPWCRRCEGYHFNRCPR